MNVPKDKAPCHSALTGARQRGNAIIAFTLERLMTRDCRRHQSRPRGVRESGAGWCRMKSVSESDIAAIAEYLAGM
jgi:cytochrome c553